MKDRIYVCHTYYHVYVTFLKELTLPEEKKGQATLILSRMSNNFETFASRALASGLFTPEPPENPVFLLFENIWKVPGIF